jgi:hypothetical protein
MSLSLEDYIAAGMPAHDRTWSSADMEKAFKVLQEVAKDKRCLPRYGSDRSGKLFDRITSERNLILYHDPSIPLTTRFPTYAQYTEALNGISKLYGSVTATDTGFGPDMVEIMGAGLRSVRTCLKLVDEKVETFDKSDPRHAARMAALEQMKRGMATMIAGCLQTVDELPGEQKQARKSVFD